MIGIYTKNENLVCRLCVKLTVTRDGVKSMTGEREREVLGAANGGGGDNGDDCC